MAHHLLVLFGLFTSLALASIPRLSHAPSNQSAAAEIIAALNLTANPEKGYYAQTFLDPLNVTYTAITANGTGEYTTVRAASTAIYYLLEGHAGAPLRLRTAWDDGTPVGEVVLGGDIMGCGGEQQRPQGFVERWEWQSARSLGEWTLVGTTVAPGFSADANTYEVATADWQPNGA